MSWNLQDNWDDLEKAFDSVEGEGFFLSSALDKDQYSIGGLTKKIQKVKESDWNLLDQDDIIGSIYGDGGIHRYYVKANGDIAFSEMHANYPSEENIANAKQVGFDIC